MDPPDIGRRLAAARTKRGLSQATVARIAGVAPSYVSRIETGKVQPAFRTVERIARAVRVPLQELTTPETASRPQQPGACPVSASGRCLLDLFRPQPAVGSVTRHEERYSPRQIRLLRRFAGWLREASVERQGALEVLLEDLDTRRTDR